MAQRPENHIQRFLNARNDAPIESKIGGLLGFGTAAYLGQNLIDRNSSLPTSFLTGHTADVFGIAAMTSLASAVVPEEAQLWKLGAVVFGLLNIREAIQGIYHTGGFDVADFAAYAIGIGLWAGVGRLAKRNSIRRD